MSTLQPTSRTTLTREKERAVGDREEMIAFLRGSLVAHVGLVADGHPVVLPSTYAVDIDGPDDGGTLYLHGSVGAGWLRASPDAQVCVTVTSIDGLVVARSGFHHSMNYRSAVVIGAARLVSDDAERLRALDLIVDHVVPGRSATLRAATRKEMVATTVLAVPLAEASMKKRTGPPKDDQADIDAGVWAGVIPLAIRAGEVEVSPDATGEPPADVVARAASFG